MTDREFLLSVLIDGEPHSQSDLLRRSFNELGHGCTVHSRIADLRRDGYLIKCDRVPGKKRGEGWTYTLLGSLEESSQSATRAHASQHASPSGTTGDGGRDDSSKEQTLFEIPERPAWA